MNNKLPKIFVNNSKPKDKKIVFYSAKDNYKGESKTHEEINSIINSIFNSKDFIYRKKIHIKTKNYDKDIIVISRTNDYILSINNDKIYIKDILDIK